MMMVNDDDDMVGEEERDGCQTRRRQEVEGQVSDVTVKRLKPGQGVRGA